MNQFTGEDATQAYKAEFQTQFEAASDFAITAIFGLMSLLAIAAIVRHLVNNLRGN